MKTGKIGTVNWEFENNVLTFGGGRFSDSFRLTNKVGEEIRWIEKIIFTDKIICGKSLSYMFDDCMMLEEIIGLDKLDTSNVTNMSGMFKFCYKLESLDLSNFNTNNVADMSEMFYCCKGLTNLDVSKLDTSNVIDMADMFALCESLTDLDVSNFDTRSVIYMDYIFLNCKKLNNKKELIRFLIKGGKNE